MSKPAREILADKDPVFTQGHNLMEVVDELLGNGRGPQVIDEHDLKRALTAVEQRWIEEGP